MFGGTLFVDAKGKKEYCGYIIKLYKTINSHQESRVPKDTDFLVWMNFDGMKVLPVYFFEDFGKSLDISDIQDIDITCERQKLNLYSIKNKDIFGISDDLKYEKKPLIVITMINFFDKKMDFDELNECIKAVIDGCTKDINRKYNVDYEIMGTLSSHDYVIVFRGDSYNDINNIIFELRINANSRQFPISITYSILAINKKDKLNWTGDKDIYASIRIALDAKVTPQDIINTLEAKNDINDAILELKKYTTFGKFDMGIEGNVFENKSKFLDLYENPKIFSGMEKTIYMTNTRFLNRRYLDEFKTNEKEEKKDDFRVTSEEQNSFNEEKEKVRVMIRELEHSSVSEKLKQSILRLILRVFQANISVYTNRESNNFFELLNGLMVLLKKWGKGANYQESIAEILRALNILLDNRISANMRDFETPHSSLRFSGSSSGLLVAYSNLVNDLSSIIGIYKEKAEQPLKYLVFVTVDIDSKISAKLFFPEDDEYRFLNVKIPVDVMYNIRYAVPWLVHETGHFLRTYQRKERNRSYFRCVFSMFNIACERYVNKRRMTDTTNLEHKKVCNAKCCSNYSKCNEKEKCKFERFYEYSQVTEQFWSMYIMESGCQSNSFYNIPDDVKGEYIYNMKEICQQIRDAYDEAVADVFMLKILNIQQNMKYFKILVKYFGNNRITINDQLPTNIVIRVLAIIMMISRAANDNPYECQSEIQLNINNIINTTDSEDIKNLCRVILNKMLFLPPAQILYKFLKECVSDQLDSLLTDENVNKLRKNILQCYSEIENEPQNFFKHIDFINMFKE